MIMFIRVLKIFRFFSFQYDYLFQKVAIVYVISFLFIIRIGILCRVLANVLLIYILIFSVSLNIISVQLFDQTQYRQLAGYKPIR